MSDDWKGEDKIRIRPLSREQRRIEDQSAIQSIVHRKRQLKGEHMSKAGGYWAKTISKWYGKKNETTDN